MAEKTAALPLVAGGRKNSGAAATASEKVTAPVAALLSSAVFLNVMPVEVVTCGKSMMTYVFLFR